MKPNNDGVGMKLYEVPRNTRIRIDGIELLFIKLDGAYSLCKTDDGETVHLAAWAEVEVVRDIPR